MCDRHVKTKANRLDALVSVPVPLHIPSELSQSHLVLLSATVSSQVQPEIPQCV